ncbi:MAG: hypothetical protein ACJ8F7_15060 [Gemmataceae bacterium]
MDFAEPPPIDPAVFDSLQAKLAAGGPKAAVAELCRTLRDAGDYAKLFYALLLKKRVEMGVLPIPTAGAAEFTSEQQADYEGAIRSACREVGNLFLKAGQIGPAFSYFNMIGEREPLVAAIEQYAPGPDDDVQPVIEVAFQQGVHPKKGFDLVVERYGICSAITTATQFAQGLTPEARNYCIRKLAQALHDQLSERLQAEIEQREGKATSGSLAELIAGRDWLFGEDSYHTDTSHLSSVVQMSIEMDDPEGLKVARDLCAYGRRLAPNLQFAGSPPFDKLYDDIDVYLGVLLGENVEGGLAHFRSKITADPEGPDSFAAEVLVRLLVRLGRLKEALAVASEYFVNVDERQLSCPGVFDLSQRLKEYGALAEVSRKRNDPVHFLAGLIAAK